MIMTFLGLGNEEEELLLRWAGDSEQTDRVNAVAIIEQLVVNDIFILK
jgi:hypothetical protein